MTRRKQVMLSMVGVVLSATFMFIAMFLEWHSLTVAVSAVIFGLVCAVFGALRALEVAELEVEDILNSMLD